MTEPESQDESTTRDVAKLADRFLQQRADERDIAIVERQLGRYLSGKDPKAAAMAAQLRETYSLLGLFKKDAAAYVKWYESKISSDVPEAVKAVSHIEAEGRMRAYNELLHDDETVAGEYRGAHRLYVAFRHELAVRLGDDESRIANVSAGGMPERVKCLHALLAQTLVMGEGVNPIGDRVLEAVTEEFSPSVCRCGSLDD